MTAALVATMQLQREAAELSVVARLIEQKLQAVKVRAGVGMDDLCQRDDVLSRSIFDARHAALLVASELDALLRKLDAERAA